MISVKGSFMKVEFVAPFLTSMISVINKVTGLDALKGNILVNPSPVAGDAVNISFGVTGAITGQVVYSMNLGCAESIASLMIGEKLTSFNDIAWSALNELANIVTGNAVNRLAANGFESVITPPTMFIGNDLTISTSMPILCIPVNLSDGGTIVIYVALKEK
jgi:chemotaxis protein CheX